MRTLSVPSCVFLLLSIAATPAAAEEHASITPNWGITTESSVVVNAWDFTPTSPAQTWDYQVGELRHLTSGAGSLRAGVSLPNGALVKGVEIQGCDQSAVDNLRASLLRATVFPTFADSVTVLTTVSSGSASCGLWRSDLMTPHTVDNASGTYVIMADHGAVFNGDLAFQAVRIIYTLQVTPPPATATFGDVPVGHALHQYVEALVAAGITAGCGGGNFCPNASVTRGQIAVFLSKALGLHWPN